MTRPPRFELGWYNGWSPDQRRATIAVQREAVASGALARPTACSICRCASSRDNPVWLHDEDYADPLAAYAVCRTCHRTLHQRFDDPAPWLALVERHRRDNAWFAMLSCDAQTQRRPFHESYPDGLPNGYTSDSGYIEHTDGVPVSSYPASALAP